MHLVMLGHGENSLFEMHTTLHDAYPDVPLQLLVADIHDRVRIERIFQQLAPISSSTRRRTSTCR